MLAFNENGKLTEYEETNFLKVCDSCHHIYKQRVEQQLEECVKENMTFVLCVVKKMIVVCKLISIILD